MSENFVPLNPKDVTHIACIGAGPIGAGWAAYFLAQGYCVKSYIHSTDEEPGLRALINNAWISLEALGLAEGASLDNFSCSNDLEATLADVQFVQESIPENMALKKALYAKLDTLCDPAVIIASSTSGLSMTDIQHGCASAHRMVVGHPFNPPYLLPLVELVKGQETSVNALDWLVEFYKIAGKAPLVLRKEIPGFIATRLQEAIWREALHMVDNDEATVEEIDFAITNGPGPRWALMGPCLTFHNGGGEGGMAYNLDQFGPALKLPWTRLEAPELTSELRTKMVDGCVSEAGDLDYAQLSRARDEGLVAIQNVLKNTTLPLT